VTFNVTATDNCSVPTVVNTPPSGSTFPVGVTTVTSTATDADGNTTTGTFTVTVRNNNNGDTVPPVITVPTNMVVGTDINQCSAVVNYTVTVTDDRPGATVVCNPASGAAFPKGITTVMCVATDVAGNQANAAFTVTVVDLQNPVLNLPADISLPIPFGESNAVVNFTVTATDNCSVPTVVSTPPSGSTFPVGVTTVTNVATDADGNLSTGTFTVTIVSRPNEGGDTIPPVITVPTNMVVGTDVNQCSAVVNYTVTVTDNVPGATVACNPASGSVFPKGVTTVNCVATDVAGNQASASFLVTVVDLQKPVLDLPMNITVVIASNETSSVVSFDVTATDNCSIPTVISTPPSGSTFPIGVTTVTNIATDGDGNTTIGTFTVTIRQDTGGDNEPPVIVSITPSRTCLWPPNHKMVPITIKVKATDNSGKKVTSRIVSVTSNEPEEDLGDGTSESDWKIVGALKVQLRAERSGTLTDRLYTITVESKDTSGNVSYGTTTVCVSHDQSNTKNVTKRKRK
jgi:hypothetical protein